VCSLRRCDQDVGSGRGNVDRFFRQHVQSVLGRGNALFGVQARWAPNHHQIHRPVRQKSREIDVGCAAVVAAKAFDIRPIRTVNRGNLHTRDCAGRTRVRFGDVPASD
jgi:hypothetical protein